MTDPHRDRHRAHFDPRQLAAELRDGGEVADHAFDRLYPAPLRTMSRVHWTPLAVARRAVELLAPLAGERMLDVGAGVGKVCLVGALRSPAHWTGLELRPALIRAAEQAARALGVAERTSFFATDMATFDWTGYDGVYLYNPFGEFLMPAAATSLRGVGPLAGGDSHPARGGRHRQQPQPPPLPPWAYGPRCSPWAPRCATRSSPSAAGKAPPMWRRKCAIPRRTCRAASCETSAWCSAFTCW